MSLIILGQDVASGGFCDFQCSPPFRGTGRAFCPPDNVDPQTELVSWEGGLVAKECIRNAGDEEQLHTVFLGDGTVVQTQIRMHLRHLFAWLRFDCLIGSSADINVAVFVASDEMK